MPEDVQIAEASTASAVEAPVTETNDTQGIEPMDTWTPAQQAKFMETGELPGSKPPKKSEPATDKAEGVTDQAQDPAKPPAETAAAKPKKSAEERLSQILTERARERQEAANLRAELERLRAAKPAEAPKAEPEGLKRPSMSDFETLADYEAAVDKYHEAKTDERIAKAEQAKAAKAEQDQRARYEREVTEGWQQRWNDAVAKESGFDDEVAAEGLQFLAPSPKQSEFIMTSDVGPQIAQHLGEHPEEGKALKGMSEIQAMRYLAKLEAKFSAGPSKPPTTEPAVTLPVTATPVSKASAPPAQLSTAATAAADEVQAAIDSGDVGAYMERMNARELKQKRG